MFLFRRCMLLGFCIAVAGCSTPHVRPAMSPIAEAERYPAINLNVDAGEYVHPAMVELVSYISSSIKESGRFLRVSTRALLSPVTISIGYSVDVSNQQTAAMMASIVTVGVVPTIIHETHRFEFEVLVGDQLLRSFKYEEVGSGSAFMYDITKLINVRKSTVDRVVEKFFADLDASQILPRVGQLRTPSPKPSGDIDA